MAASLQAVQPQSECTSERPSVVTGRLDLPNDLLYDLLSVSLVMLQTTPYLSLADIFALSGTNSKFRKLLFSSSESFRYLDLSLCKAANAASNIAPVDVGGNQWRSQRMDEALTEDEFYAGPLRGIFNRLASARYNNILVTVTTLVLDGLTVPADLVREIIAESRFNVRILSIREAQHLNERKLRQMLRYAVRASRPEGTPRLKGLYVFGPKDKAFVISKISQSAVDPLHAAKLAHAQVQMQGVTHSAGAQLGAALNAMSAAALEQESGGERWFAGAGRVLKKSSRSAVEWREWAELLEDCEGIISFDAVLCRGPRHDLSLYVAEGGPVHPPGAAPQATRYLPPTIATISLKGCDSCKSCPEGLAEFATASRQRLPLLAPPPLHSANVRAAQNPSSISDRIQPRTSLVLRCEECLRSRWCEHCNVWWDEKCYPLHIGGVLVGDSSIKVQFGSCVRNCLVGEVLMSGMGEGGMWG